MKSIDRSFPDVATAIRKRGGPEAVAKWLGVSLRTVHNWRVKVPAERVAFVSAALGVPKWRIRPDLHDPPPPAKRPVSYSETPPQVKLGFAACSDAAQREEKSTPSEASL
jgi:DNA-binding transcriptional regulator YdaS (Cro superfamily)